MALERSSPAASAASRQAIAAGIGPYPATRAGGVLTAEQSVVGDDEFDGDRDGDLGGAAGDAFDEGVGHDLAAAAAVAAGVGFAAQGGVDRDAVSHR